jgi:hypothetical protein
MIADRKHRFPFGVSRQKHSPSASGLQLFGLDLQR